MTEREKLKSILIECSGNLLIYGKRGLGKSTFVLDTAPHMENTIYLNLQNLAGGDAKEFKEYLADECNDQLNITEQITSSNLKSIIKKHRVTVILDEWEMLIQSDLITFFIELIQLHTRIILIGFHQLRDLIKNKSQLLLIEPSFSKIEMPALAESETVEIMNNFGLVIDDQAKILLHQETKGHGRFLTTFLVSLKCDYSGETILESHIKDSVAKVKKSIYWCDPSISMQTKDGQTIMQKISGSQQKILKKILAGEPDDLIAKSLSIHPGTVRNQITKICDRLGVPAGSVKRKMRRSDLIRLCAEYSMFCPREN